MLRPGNLLNLFPSHIRCVLTVNHKDATVTVFFKMPGIGFAKLMCISENFHSTFLLPRNALRSKFSYL